MSLSFNLENEYSKSLVADLKKEESVFLNLLLEMKGINETKSITIANPVVIKSSNHAKLLAKLSSELRYNESLLLMQAQEKVTEAQWLIESRLLLSEEVSMLTRDINDARQVDRDFALSVSDKEKEIYAQQVTQLLDMALLRTQKIQTMLIEEDEEKVFERVYPNVREYLNDFLQVVEITKKSDEISRLMVATVLKADNNLFSSRQQLFSEMDEAGEVAKYMIYSGLLFMVALFLLAFFIRKSQIAFSDMSLKLNQARDASQGEIVNVF